MANEDQLLTTSKVEACEIPVVIDRGMRMAFMQAEPPRGWKFIKREPKCGGIICEKE